MRWTVIGLFLVNIVFFLWNWLEYSHSRSVGAMNASAAASDRANMPGAKVVLLKESDQVLLLLSDQPLASSQEVSRLGAAAPNATQPSSVVLDAQQGVPLCILLGPYPEGAAAKALIDRLNALQIQGTYASVQVAGESDYWVYLAPEPTKELAALKLRELQEKKVDSFIIPQGDLANGISLGVFDKQENAQSRQKAIAELGYAAQLRVNSRNYLENWVVLYPDESAKFSPELYNKLHVENNNLDLRKDECSKVASTIDIH